VRAVLAALVGCALAHAAFAETIETGMIGSANAPGWPWYIGEQKGWFKDAGITLDISYASTASGLVQQAAAGSLDLVADVGVVEPLHAVEKGAPVAMIRIIGQVPPYEIDAKPAIASIKDLRGKTVCIGGFVDINRVYLERIMQANGLKDGQYDIITAGNTAARFAALKSGASDASMLAPPFNFFAEDAGFHKIGMILDYAKDLPFSATVVSRAYAEKHRDTLLKLQAVLDRSVAWFDDPSHRAEAIEILEKEMKSSDVKSVTRSYDYFHTIDYFAPNDDISRAKIKALVDAMKALGDIKRDIPADTVAMPGLTRLVD
jgi:NitT/TauT family transport system substrate-binding protein